MTEPTGRSGTPPIVTIIGAVDCDWCGRAIYRSPNSLAWRAVKGAERGYDPNMCDASENGHHEPSAAARSQS